MLRLIRPVRRAPRSRTAVPRLARLAVTTAAAVAVAVAATSMLGMSASGSVTSTLRLASQSAFIADPGTFSISLDIHASAAPEQLGVEFELYSKLPDRTAFAESTTNTELQTESCLAQSPVLPISSLAGGATNGTVPFTIPFTTTNDQSTCATTSTTFALDCPPTDPGCPGVYPLSVAVVDRGSGRITQSLTTHVVIATSSSGSFPLRVSLVFPLGAQPTLNPSGSSDVGSSVPALAAEVNALSRSRARLSVALYPNLLRSLKGASTRKATGLLHSIDALVSHARPGARVELLTTPFANIDASALAAAGLGGDVRAGIARGQLALVDHYAHAIANAPYASQSPVDMRGLAALQKACLSEFVVPESSVSAFAGRTLTPTAPLLVGKAEQCGSTRQPPVAFVAETALSEELSTNSDDPVLAGENLLADLAQVYFEIPFANLPRAVVALAERPVNPTLLRVVLDGLRSNPILETAQLSTIFSKIPVGSNNNLATATLDGTPGQDAPSAAAVAGARRAEHAVEMTTPSNQLLLSSLGDSIFIGESTGMTRERRAAFLGAPTSALKTIGNAIAISGSGSVTLTSARGRVPITISSALTRSGPVHILVHLSSRDLLLPANPTQRITLTSKDYNETVSIGTRTSGADELDVILYSATGGFELDRRIVSVRSTAVSGVAIALSAAALLVLLAWWFRSIVRTRRRHHATPTTGTT